MINSRRWIVIALFCFTVVIVAIIPSCRKARKSIKVAHTGFLFSQLEQQYAAYLSQGRPPADSAEAFLKLIPQWTIDWNSCRLRDKTLYDGWSTQVQVKVVKNEVDLRSASADCQFNTADDIQIVFPLRKAE